jgi:hypothetical protein
MSKWFAMQLTAKQSESVLRALRGGGSGPCSAAEFADTMHRMAPADELVRPDSESLQLTEQLAPTLHSTARGSDSAGAHAQVRRPRTPPERGGRPHCRAARTSASGPIFDKLTDPRHYTGAHRQRFDKNGKGRGRAGRMEVRASDIDIDNFDTGWSKRARGQRAKPTPLFGLIDIDRSAGICSLPPAPRARAVCLP